MKLRTTILDWLSITFGTTVIALAVFFFLIPSHLTISSISGLAILLSNFLPLSVAALTMIMNIILLIVGFLFFGKSFGIKTIYTSILLPALLAVLEVLFPNNTSLTGDMLTDMLCYCFVVSIGLAILFNCNASSGGIDIIAKLLNHFFHMDLGQAMSVAGMCVSVSAIFVYDIKTVLLSVLGTYINGIVLDHFIFGATVKKRVCIVSQKVDAVREFILHTLHSGATLYKAYGAYSEDPKTEIITIVDKSEYQKLMRYLSTEDPDAFVTVYTVNSIRYRPKTKHITKQ